MMELCDLIFFSSDFIRAKAGAAKIDLADFGPKLRRFGMC